MGMLVGLRLLKNRTAATQVAGQPAEVGTRAGSGALSGRSIFAARVQGEGMLAGVEALLEKWTAAARAQVPKQMAGAAWAVTVGVAVEVAWGAVVVGRSA